MQSRRFPLGAFGYSVLIIAWVVSILLILFLGRYASGRLNIERDWLRLLIILGCIISPSVFITWSFLVEMTTTYSDKGISRKTFQGRQLIEWHSIKEIDTGMFALTIKLQKKRYFIRLLMYKIPQEVAEYIETHYNNSHS